MKTHHFFTLMALASLTTDPAIDQTNVTPASSLAYSGNAGWIDPKAGDGTQGLVLV